MIHPARERLHDPEELEESAEPPDDRVPLLERAPDIVWQVDDVRQLWEEEGLEPQRLDGAARLEALPRSQPHVFEAQRPAIAARGLAEAENELASMLRQGRRVVVTFQHRGEAQRTQRLLRKVDAAVDEDIETPCGRLAPFCGQPGASGVRLA